MIRVTDKTSPLFDHQQHEITCKSKKVYTTPYHAQFAIDECQSRGVKGLRYYKCPYCKNYHLTST